MNGNSSPAGSSALPGLHGTASDSLENRGSIARRIGRNVGIVVSGNAAVAAFGLVTLALNARALGTAGLGVLALIMTIATLVDRIAAFQTWQPLIKLGAEALAVGDKPRVGQLITVAFLFDVGAAVAGAVAAVLLVFLAGERFGIPADHVGVAAIYMATLVTRVADAPTGVMRLFDRFGLLTTLRTGEAAGQLLATVVLFLIGAPLSAYVLSFAAVAVATNVALFGCALHIADRNDVAPVLRSLRAAWSANWREFWSFSWMMSVLGTLNVVRERMPVLLIGALLGPAAVGIYHVADRLAGILIMIKWPFSLALYPEAARLGAAQRYGDLQWFVVRIGAVAGAIALFALLGTVALGETVLLVVGGHGYGEAYGPAVLLVAAYCFGMAGIGLHSAVLVTGGPKPLLTATLLPFTVFSVVLPLAVGKAGLQGAAAAQSLFYFLWIAVSIREFRAALLRNRTAVHTEVVSDRGVHR